MKSIKALTILLCSCAVGCSSVSRDLSFSQQDPSAFVVIATDGLVINGMESYYFTFKEVNLEKSEFGPESFTINLSSSGAEFGDELKRPKEIRSSVRYGAKKVTPGQYSLYMLRKDASYGTLNTRNFYCYSFGTDVYEFAPGFVNLISVGNIENRTAPDVQQALKNVDAILATYPNIVSPIKVREKIAVIQFDGGQGPLGGKKCNPNGTFKDLSDSKEVSG